MRTDADNYEVYRGSDNTVTVCYYENVTNDKAFWKSENYLISSVPFFIIQLSIMMVCIRLLFFLLKPLRQPRFLAELIVSTFFFSFLFLLSTL